MTALDHERLALTLGAIICASCCPGTVAAQPSSPPAASQTAPPTSGDASSGQTGLAACTLAPKTPPPTAAVASSKSVPPAAAGTKDKKEPPRDVATGFDIRQLGSGGDERQLYLPGESGCQIALTLDLSGTALPAKTARYGYRVLAQSGDADKLLRIELVADASSTSRISDRADQAQGATTAANTAPATPESQTSNQSPVEFDAAAAQRVRNWSTSSDAARPEQQLSVPAGFSGSLRIVRLDLNSEPTVVRVRLFRDDLQGLEKDSSKREGKQSLVFQPHVAGSGTSFRMDMSNTDYALLVGLAGGYRERTAVSAHVKNRVYSLVSQLFARRMEEGVNEFATRTEPMVVFLGVSGLNKIALIDCQGWPMPSKKANPESLSDCERVAEPWQTTFEGANAFWVAYVEDDLTNFDTSIDLQYGDNRPTPDYDEFDPHSTLRLPAAPIKCEEPVSRHRLADWVRLRRHPPATPLSAAKCEEPPGATPNIDGAEKPRAVRIGFRRFRIPDGQRVARITFSRQGPTYGLRSWARDFRRYGSRWPRFAAGLAVGAPLVTRRSLELENVYAGDAREPTALSVAEDLRRQPLMVTAFMRFPQVRAAAEQATTGWRLFVPGVAAGVGFPPARGGIRDQTMAIGPGWQLSNDERFHFVLLALTHRAYDSTVAVGDRVPLSATPDVLTTRTRFWSAWLGLSVDIVKSR